MFYFDLYPKMVPADEVSVIRIRPRFAHVEFQGEVKVLLSPYDRTGAQYEPEWHLENGTLVIKAQFDSEQEHCTLSARQAYGRNYMCEIGHGADVG